MTPSLPLVVFHMSDTVTRHSLPSPKKPTSLAKHDRPIEALGCNMVKLQPEVLFITREVSGFHPTSEHPIHQLQAFLSLVG